MIKSFKTSIISSCNNYYAKKTLEYVIYLLQQFQQIKGIENKTLYLQTNPKLNKAITTYYMQ